MDFIKYKRGKRLSSGSDYDSSFQVESINQISKNNWSFKSNLPSTLSSNSKGLLVRFKHNYVDGILLSPINFED